MKYSAENQTIQTLAPQIMRMAAQGFSGPLQVNAKSHAGDVVTTLDKQVDKFLTAKLRRAFEYQVISEESFSGGAFPEQGKVWVIDPICGTSNLARGIKFFCTNIALVEDGSVRAAWVINHSRGEVLWSTGGGKVQRGRQTIQTIRTSPVHGGVDIDWGYWFHLPQITRNRFSGFARLVALRDDLTVWSTGSSLVFAYVATGQMNGAVVINVHAWDIISSAFLIEQNGGVVTNFDGSPWTLRSRSVVMAGNGRVHRILLNALKKNNLGRIR